MIPILFTVSYAGFWGQERLSLKETLQKAKDIGYEGIELMAKRPHLSPVDLSDDDVGELKDTIDGLGLDVATLAAYTNFTAGLESREVPMVEIQLTYIERLCQFAQILDCQLVRIFTGYSTDQMSYWAQRDMCVEAVQDACDVAAKYGVNIGVQNHHDIGVGVEAYEAFLNDVDRDNCKAMFDAWSVAQFEGTDLYEAAKRMAPRMMQTTVADYVRQPRYRYITGLTTYERVHDIVRAVPMGEGFIDYDAFFQGLRDGGFDGYVAYEMCSPVRGGGCLENLDRAAAVALQEIRRLSGG
jgi:sugar phosphate isomerase/epimerase